MFFLMFIPTNLPGGNFRNPIWRGLRIFFSDDCWWFKTHQLLVVMNFRWDFFRFPSSPDEGPFFWFFPQIDSKSRKCFWTCPKKPASRQCRECRRDHCTPCGDEDDDSNDDDDLVGEVQSMEIRPWINKVVRGRRPFHPYLVVKTQLPISSWGKQQFPLANKKSRVCLFKLSLFWGFWICLVQHHRLRGGLI